MGAWYFVIVSLMALIVGKADVLLEPQLSALTAAEEILNQQLGQQILEDLETMNKTCPTGRCKIDKDNRMSDAPDWTQRNCMCDNDCVKFGDCCPDARHFHQGKQQEANALFACKKFRQYHELLIISTCPQTWSNPETRALCQQTNITDPISMTPVTSKKTGLTYNNIHCAICNGLSVSSKEDDVKLWQLRFECPDLLAEEQSIKKLANETAKTLVSWNSANQSWGVTLDAKGGKGPVFHTCYLFPFIPEDLKFYVRPCVSTTDDCPDDWTDLDVHSKCLSYTSVLYHNDQLFRNAHCALCNNVPLNDLLCETSIVGRFYDTRDFDFNAFALLFDLNSKDGSSVVGQQKTCAEGELYDLHLGKCSKVFCSQGQEYHEGSCRNQARKPGDDIVFPEDPGSTTFNATHNEKEPFASCVKFLVSKDQVQQFANGTMYVMPYNSYYERGQYRMNSDGQAEICANVAQTVSKFGPELAWITLIGLGLSEICLIFHLIAYVLTSDLRTFSGHLLAFLSVALFAAYGSFIAAQFMERGTSSCYALAVCVYYFFLAAFWWSSVLAWDVWSTIRIVTTKLRSPAGSPRLKIFLYSMYAWLVPALVVVAAVLIDTLDSGRVLAVPIEFHPQFGESSCWFGQRKALLVYFAAPLAVIMAVNLLLFAWSAFMIYSATSQAASSSTRDSKKQLWLYFRLALIMGLSWITGLIAGAVDVNPLWYVFVILCTCQGLFIFLAFTCKKKVLMSLRNRFKCCHRPGWRGASYGMAIVSDEKDGKLLRRHGLDLQDSHDGPPSSSRSRTSLTMVSSN